MAAPGVMRSMLSRAALWAGSVQLLFVAFGIVQAYLMVRGMSDGSDTSTRADSVQRVFRSSGWWCVAQVATGGVLVALGWLGRRLTRDAENQPSVARTATCAVLVFILAQVLANSVAAALSGSA